MWACEKQKPCPTISLKCPIFFFYFIKIEATSWHPAQQLQSSSMEVSILKQGILKEAKPLA